MATTTIEYKHPFISILWEHRPAGGDWQDATLLSGYVSGQGTKTLEVSAGTPEEEGELQCTLTIPDGSSVVSESANLITYTLEFTGAEPTDKTITGVEDISGTGQWTIEWKEGDEFLGWDSRASYGAMDPAGNMLALYGDNRYGGSAFNYLVVSGGITTGDFRYVEVGGVQYRFEESGGSPTQYRNYDEGFLDYMVANVNTTIPITVYDKNTVPGTPSNPPTWHSGIENQVVSEDGLPAAINLDLYCSNADSYESEQDGVISGRQLVIADGTPEGTYNCQVKAINSAGEALSNAFTWQVTAGVVPGVITITSQPQDVTILEPDGCVFEVTAVHESGAPLFYDWVNRLTWIAPEDQGDPARYWVGKTYPVDTTLTARCRIRHTSADNATDEVYTRHATITHTKENPVITVQPPATVEIANEGDGATVSIQATYGHPEGEILYIWEASTDGGSTWVQPDHALSDVDIQSIRAKTLIINSTTTGPSRDPTLIYPEHMSYSGQFSVEHGGGGSYKNPSYGGHCLALHPDRDKLFFGASASGRGGKDGDDIGIINIPAMDGTATWVGDTVFIPGEIGVGSKNLWAGGFCYNNKLYLAKLDSYDNSPGQGNTHCTATLDLQTFTPMVPADYALGHPTGSKKFLNAYMCAVPPEHQAAVGAPALIGGGSMSILTSGPNGWSISAFDPEDVGSDPGTPFPIIPLMYDDDNTPLVGQDWRYLSPETGNESFRPPPNLLWTRGSQFATGFFWPSGTNSILCIGRKGLGEFRYKVKGRGGAKNCDTGAGDGKEPYRMQVWAYDARDVIAAASSGHVGLKPYAVWELPTHPTVGVDCVNPKLGAGTWDDTLKRYYWCTDYKAGANAAVQCVDINFP